MNFANFQSSIFAASFFKSLGSSNSRLLLWFFALQQLVASWLGFLGRSGFLGIWTAFSFDIWSFREFPYIKICFRQFCSVFGKFIHSFSSLFEISAKFCYFCHATSWLSPRKFNLLTSQVAPKQPNYSFRFIFSIQFDTKLSSFYLVPSYQFGTQVKECLQFE